MKNKIKLLTYILIFFLNLKSEELIVLPFFDGQAALEFIKKYLPEDPIIVEAGAYDGEETLKMVKLWPKCTVHAFEPVPYIYKKLIENTQSYKNIFRYLYALGNKNGAARFYISADPSQPDIPTTSGSLLPAKDHLKYHFYTFKNNTLVKVTTLDTWAKKFNINKIDLLWLDMQGYELFALKEGLEVLKNVKVIYTEIEFVEAYAGQPLFEEVKEWLISNNFKLIATDVPLSPIPSNRWCCNAVFINSKITS